MALLTQKAENGSNESRKSKGESAVQARLAEGARVLVCRLTAQTAKAISALANSSHQQTMQQCSA